MAKAKKNVKEYVGELRVTGEIDLAQFWPNKKSDADTVTVQATNLEFSRDPKTKPFKKTTVFSGAWIGKSKGKRQLVVHKGGKITIRLQGIDATELHFKEYFKSGLKGNVEYREFLAETATTKLHDFLAGGGGSKVACRVTTRVDLPNQVFDIYRRFVGDVWVKVGGQWKNANHWLVRQAWAFPSFYDTMRNEEIQAILKLASQAKKALGFKSRVWGQLIPHVGPLNTGMQYRSKGQPNPQADIGNVIMPKLFRRLVTFTIDGLNTPTTDNFHDYLGKLKDDLWVNTTTFLKNRGAKRNVTLAPPLDNANNFQADPEKLVFSEKTTPALMGANGKPISRFE
ncbi:MAG TPA: thermonuclease family protein [Pyrinomonadaceae bacterium]|jgi:endonuclease YncB( thermonuclease family)